MTDDAMALAERLRAITIIGDGSPKIPLENDAIQAAAVMLADLAAERDAARADAARLRADLASAAEECSVGECEQCQTPLFGGDNYVYGDDGVVCCWHAMTSNPPDRASPCYAYRVGKQDARNCAALVQGGCDDG